MKNSEWANKILRIVDKGFKPKWEIYNETLISYFSKEITWIDCGSGKDMISEEYRHLVKNAFSIDLEKPQVGKEDFVKADLKYIPVKTGSADLITLRFVVEHFEERFSYISEWHRILSERGKILISTTNLLSPIIFIPKLLPDFARRKLITTFFKVSPDDVFKAYHKFNTQMFYNSIRDKFEIVEIKYLSDLNITTKWIFLLLLAFHLITKISFFRYLRTNLFIILKKK